MCGINGIIRLSKSNLDLKETITTMNKTLDHRGPDDNGFWIHENDIIALGQTRLSILDLSSAGHQPMKDPETGNIIVFNGEIFNYRRLNDKYLKNEKFFSSSDTETILKLYNAFGLQMISMLNGMFAFALWDASKQKLILARDRSGKKPLNYTALGGNFSFSSELKALFDVPGTQRKLDHKVLYDFLTFNTVAAPHTMFLGISKFEPGYYMVVSDEGIETYEAFHDLKKIELDFSTEEELSNLVFNKLRDSVNDRMISDVPVGAFLSGGVDSSAVVALMRENTQEEIKTFTVGFEGQPKYNELIYAEKISKTYNTNHYVKTITPNDIVEFIPKIADIYDEPQADTTAIPIYFISQLSKEQNIKVVLNGDGPDELFSGYSNYERYVKLNRFYSKVQKSPYFIKKVVKQVIGLINKGIPAYEMANRLEQDHDLYWPGASGLKEGTKHNLLSDEFTSRINGHSSYQYVDQLKKEYLTFLQGNKFDYINWLCFSGYKNAITERFLFRADRLGMANSIEARSPFLNHEMVELALSIPGNYKIKNGVNKYILKKSLERILPQEILYRKKMGFNVPIREWASETIYNYVNDNIDQFAKETNIFRADHVKLQLKALKEGRKEFTNNIWTIFFLMNWFNRWL